VPLLEQELMQYPIAAITLTLFALNAGGIAAGATLTLLQYDSAMRKALSLSSQREYTEACRILESAALQAKEDGKKEWEATMLSFLGSIYQRAGRYAEAEDSLNTSIREFSESKGPDARELIGPLANLGGLYYEAKQYSHAEQLIKRSLELQLPNDGEDPKLTGMLLTNLGSVYFSEHKDEEARQSAEQAIEKFAVVKNPGMDTTQGTARNYALLGALNLAQHNLSDAQSYLMKARAMWETAATPDDPRRAESVANLGIYYSAAGDYQKAESLFKEANTVFQNSGGNNAYMQHFLGEYYGVEQRLGHKKEAKQLLKQLKQLANVSAASSLSRNVVDVNAFRASN
jgi:tetratricopeptide (TPR) repeat protein